ncbi:MAG TPA: glycerol-3-phosphate dehydrogenase [Gammaproteobacteria bacterium]|nr:glycerol-3-phosphate dehydrogenase [Gammaproteobacteria bacterium]
MLPGESRFELIVIGGGINGAAIAREAALSGVRVLLLERDDFCSGTSAVSSRLIHGGLRYLEHGELALVRESLAERERLLKLAPHLVEPLEIFLPLTHASRRGRLTIRLGMWLYDLLSFDKSLPSHRMLSREAMLEALPGLDAEELLGGAAYFDAQVRYPERLVLENALDAEAAGATLASHTAARELIVEAGRVAGVVWDTDGGTGKAFASVVVNAAGPWVDRVLGRFSTAPLVGGTKGSHLVARPFTGAPPKAVYAEAASDGRPFFVIPWNGLYLIGTTDERYDGDPSKAAISDSEYRYLVTETRRLFPGAADLERRICYTSAGIRPLPPTEGVSEGAITRAHLIERHRDIDGLYSIVGGKLTTHRALARDCMKRLRHRLRARGQSPTADRPLPGALAADDRDALLSSLADAFGTATAARLWQTYGSASLRLMQDARENDELGQRLGADTDLRVGELVHAIEREHARTLVDVLQRRTMSGLESDFGKSSAPLAADWLVRLCYWDKEKAAEEVAAYRRFSRRHAVPSPQENSDRIQ